MKILLTLLTVFTFAWQANSQINRKEAPKAQPNPAIAIEIPEEMIFSNGLKVIVVENHKLPQVSFQLFVDYPELTEKDKTGLASVFGEMLGSGTKTTTKDEFDQQIDFMGASFYASSTGFYASSLTKHSQKLLKLLDEVIREPAFTQDDFDRIISANLSNLAAIPSSPDAMAENVSSVVNYGNNHPYGEITTEATLNAITLDDVKEFYKNYFIPNYAYLVIVGDITTKEAKEIVDNYFISWPKAAAIEQPNYTVPRASGQQVYFVEKPGAVQSVIQVTNNIKLTPGHADVLPLNVMNNILGGGTFSARLMRNLREDKAYTYGAYSSISSDPLIGYFNASGNFRNEVTDSAIVQLLKEIKTISTEEVTDYELDLVKKSMTGSFARSLERPQTIANFALNIVRYNLPRDYYTDYLKRLEALTKADILAAAKKYLTPDDINIIVVGSEDVVEKLKVLDSDGEIAYKDYYGEEKALTKPAAEGVTAQTVIDNYILKTFMVADKSELPKKLKKIKMIETISKSEMPEFSATIIIYSLVGAENMVADYMMIKSPMGNQVAQKKWFNGTNGVETAMMDTKAIEGDDLNILMNKNAIFPQLKYGQENVNTIELIGVETISDKEYHKIKVTPAFGTDYSFEYYSVETGLLMIHEIFSSDAEGNPVTVRYEHSNYEAVNEQMLMPKASKLNAGGQILDLKVTEVTIGKKAKAKAFDGDFTEIANKLSK
ncbi:M16 family metallopeptidase [Crocinitomix catalasitica]|uniref:M16 family metallopeptidase n=1 Tax=Crocinitomix catalasitica TaxID=184607 RepID=UPI000B1D2813|nr:pitrilysin family protein [Crocinitomix catalasitica]